MSNKEKSTILGIRWGRKLVSLIASYKMINMVRLHSPSTLDQVIYVLELSSTKKSSISNFYHWVNKMCLYKESMFIDYIFFLHKSIRIQLLIAWMLLTISSMCLELLKLPSEVWTMYLITFIHGQHWKDRISVLSFCS